MARRRFTQCCCSYYGCLSLWIHHSGICSTFSRSWIRMASECFLGTCLRRRCCCCCCDVILDWLLRRFRRLVYVSVCDPLRYVVNLTVDISLFVMTIVISAAILLWCGCNTCHPSSLWWLVNWDALCCLWFGLLLLLLKRHLVSNLKRLSECEDNLCGEFLQWYKKK